MAGQYFISFSSVASKQDITHEEKNVKCAPWIKPYFPSGHSILWQITNNTVTL